MSPGPRAPLALAILRHPATWGALAAVLAYLPTLGHGFVWDDHRLIEQNPLLRSASGLARLLVSDFWFISGTQSGFWRPLVTLSYALDGHLGQWRAFAFHLGNLSLHALTSAAVGVLVLRAGVPRLAAAVAAIAFALLPAHVESVAWIAGRTDVLCGLFLALAFLRDRSDRARGRTWPGALALTAYALALLAKEAAAPGLLVLAIAEWVGERGRARRFADSARWLAPYAALTLVWAVLHLALVHEGTNPADVSALALERARWAGWTMMAGNLAFLLPWGTHSPQMALRLPASMLAPEVIGGALLTLALPALLLVAAIRRSRWAVPLGWFLLTLAPPIVMMLTRSQLVFSERLLYVPSIGAAWMLGLALAMPLSPGPARAVAAALAAAWLAANAFVTVRLLPPWADDFELFRAMTLAQPRNATAQIAYGFELLQRGEDDLARAAIARADSLDPGRARVHHARGLLAMRRGEWPTVIAEADRALALDPALTQARLMRATALLRTGHLAEAADELTRLRAQAAADPRIEALDGELLLLRGDPAAAQPRLEDASRWVNDDADLFYALGLAEARLQHVAEARDAFEHALGLEPGFYDAWLKLATACHLLGDATARDAALARAEALPEAADGVVGRLRQRLAAGGP